MSLNYWKREKILRGVMEKHYSTQPEEFPYDLLDKRLHDEWNEYKEAYENFMENPTSEYNTELMKELADLSNFIDYMANKLQFASILEGSQKSEGVKDAEP